MTNLSTFNYLTNTVRVVEIDSQPWFVAVDLYSVLFGRTTGVSVREFIQPDETKVIRKVSAPDALTSLFTGTRYQIALLAESALYKLIMRSDKPEAREFQDWVTREVLPSIRKDGMYVAGEEKVKTGEISDLSDAGVLVTQRGYNEVNTHRFRQAVDEKQITHIVGAGNGGTGQLFIS